MRRIALWLPFLVVLLAPASAMASSRFAYDIPKLVAKPLVAVKKGTDIPVLLPSKMTTEFKKLYSAGRGRKTRYKFEIGAARNCHSATACFVAEFRGRQGGKASGKRKVKLARGHTGWFTPSRCGASCGCASAWSASIPSSAGAEFHSVTSCRRQSAAQAAGARSSCGRFECPHLRRSHSAH